MSCKVCPRDRAHPSTVYCNEHHEADARNGSPHIPAHPHWRPMTMREDVR